MIQSNAFRYYELRKALQRTTDPEECYAIQRELDALEEEMNRGSEDYESIDLPLQGFGHGGF